MATKDQNNEVNVQTQKVLLKILEAISNRPIRIILWGVNPVCFNLLRELSSYGLMDFVVGVVDNKFKGREVGRLKVVDLTELHDMNFDTLVITEDKDKESVLLRYSQVDNKLPQILLAGTGHLDFTDPTFSRIVDSCAVKSKAGGYPNMLIHIYQSLVYLVQRKLKGAVAEFGVFQGGTTSFIAKTLRELGSNAEIYGFDTFEGFPPRRNVLDLSREEKCEFKYYETVKRYLEPFGVKLFKGDISSTYKKIKGIPLMFSFFDTDNYSPTRDALVLCYEQTVPGGILAFDHYYCDERLIDTVGERIAVKEILSDKKVFNLHGTGIFIKF